MTVFLPNLAFSGYRSFGKEPQYFDQFAKINILIGRNNSGKGKSNVLRAIKEVLPQVCDRGPLKLGERGQVHLLRATLLFLRRCATRPSQPPAGGLDKGRLIPRWS